ncbi:MAG: NMD3-related protein [Candidatus Micrarchaeota archaeon]
MEKLCPSCGARSSSKNFVGAFCVDCASKKIDISLPPKFEFQKCKRCGKVNLGEWRDAGESELAHKILKSAKGSFENARAEFTADGLCALTFIVKKNSSFIEVKRAVPIEFLPAICTDCTRASGGYYEAIVQIRGERERVEKFKQKFLRDVARDTFISKIEEMKEGADLYVGSKEAVAEILHSYGKKATRSDKLFGLKDGKRLYRTTYCVRV